MAIKAFKNFLFLFLICFFINMAGFVSAEIGGWQLEISIPGIEAGTPIKEPGQYLQAVFRFAVMLAAILAVVMIIFGGFLWMTAPAIANKEKGREMIYGAIGGLILLLASHLILYTINPALVGLSSPQLQDIDINVDNGDNNEVKPNEGTGPDGPPPPPHSSKAHCENNRFPLPAGALDHYGPYGGNTAPDWGLDFHTPIGTQIYAIKGGTVQYNNYNGYVGSNWVGHNDKGQIKIDHGDGTWSYYGHMSEVNSQLKTGDHIAAGSPIGKSGIANGAPHLHMEIHTTINGQDVYMDPYWMANCYAGTEMYPNKPKWRYRRGANADQPVY